MITSLIEIGRIVNRHGVGGELRMLPHNPTSSAMDHLPELVLHTPGGAEEPRRVLGARRHKRFILLRIEGVHTANEAEALVGCTVSIKEDLLPPPNPDEVYYRDLVGCTVSTEQGQMLGTVHEVFATGSNDVCVVREGTNEHLIPLIHDVVIRLDIAKRELVIRPLPGLLDP